MLLEKTSERLLLGNHSGRSNLSDQIDMSVHGTGHPSHTTFPVDIGSEQIFKRLNEGATTVPHLKQKHA